MAGAAPSVHAGTACAGERADREPPRPCFLPADGRWRRDALSPRSLHAALVEGGGPWGAAFPPPSSFDKLRMRAAEKLRQGGKAPRKLSRPAVTRSPHPELVEGGAEKRAPFQPPSSFDRLRMRAAERLHHGKKAPCERTCSTVAHAALNLSLSTGEGKRGRSFPPPSSFDGLRVRGGVSPGEKRSDEAIQRGAPPTEGPDGLAALAQTKRITPPPAWNGSARPARPAC